MSGKQARILYCLRCRGEVRERTWLLAAGESTLGRSEVNDLVVRAQGVSRRHARLCVDREGVELTDLASTNGSFVNGERIERARVGPGDALRFGSVALELQEIDPGDARLAFEIPSDAGPERGEGHREPPDDKETDRLHGATAWLAPSVEEIERFLDRLVAPGEPEVPEILDALMRELHAGGACLLEWPGGREPLVVASRGLVEDLTEHRSLRLLTEEMTQSSNVCCRSGASTAPPLAYAVLGRPGAIPLCLVVFSLPAGDQSEKLVRVALRLLAWLPGREPAPAAGAGRHRPALRFPSGFVVGASQVMERLYDEVRTLCRGDLPVLITGETGVGKEHVARILHLSSERARGPFLAVNCAAIPTDLLEAEMFGVAEGAATGVRTREGLLARARGGTLLLDELADMPPLLQAKLLRAVQEKEIQPVGGRPVAVDVRIVAATNRDLLAAVEAGRFRSDLYYRVAGAVLLVPPLRERREDIAALIESFLRAAAKASGRSIRGLTVKALDALVAHEWPGNVRQLVHEVHRLVQACPDGLAIDSTMLPARLAAAPPAAVDSGQQPESSLRLERHVEDLERRLLGQALEKAGGSQRKAAVQLGISRNALARKMRRLGMRE